MLTLWIILLLWAGCCGTGSPRSCILARRGETPPLRQVLGGIEVIIVNCDEGRVFYWCRLSLVIYSFGSSRFLTRASRELKNTAHLITFSGYLKSRSIAVVRRRSLRSPPDMLSTLIGVGRVRDPLEPLSTNSVARRQKSQTRETTLVEEVTTSSRT